MGLLYSKSTLFYTLCMYQDYVWIKGAPCGVESSQKGIYKIVEDPYGRRISIEEYASDGKFISVVYDSAEFDFRFLLRKEMQSWKRVTLDDAQSLIIDHDDRIILREKHLYKESLPRVCYFQTPNGRQLAEQKMFYKILGDLFNGVKLFDIKGKPILIKHYEFDENARQFTVLLKEFSDMTLNLRKP